MRIGATLGRVCRHAREHAGIRAIDIATAAGVSEAAVSRFERGEGWPRRVDDIVATYERECGLPPRELWRRAITDD